jgi:hypothetical protein
MHKRFLTPFPLWEVIRLRRARVVWSSSFGLTASGSIDWVRGNGPRPVDERRASRSHFEKGR